MDDAISFVKQVYQGKYKDGNTDKKSVNAYARKFGDALEKGWKQAGKTISFDYDSPDTKMLNALRDNIFHFSAAKNRAEIIQLSSLLRDSKGKLRSWQSFKEEAVKVTSDFRERYMKVEYDMAVNSSYLAARWQEYDADDILEYQTAGDPRVRDSHKAMDGISLPKSHPFWQTFYPPNGWNCRCTVVVSSSKRITPEDKLYADPDTVQPIFRSNFAEEGWVFPKDHPYWNQNTQLIDLKNDTTPYEIDRTPNNNKVYESRASHKHSKKLHERQRQKIEYTQNRITARLMADYYNDDVLLMPEFSDPNKDVKYIWEYLNRGYLYKPKMADSLLIKNNKFYEVKSYEGTYKKEKMAKMMNKVQGQAEIGVLYFNQDVPLKYITKDFEAYLNSITKNKKHFDMISVFAVVNGQLHKLY